jgi:hypothetical protein
VGQSNQERVGQSGRCKLGGDGKGARRSCCRCRCCEQRKAKWRGGKGSRRCCGFGGRRARGPPNRHPGERH